MNSSVLSILKIRGRSPIIFRLDKARAVSVLNSFENDPLLVCFLFLIQLLIRVKLSIKSHVRLYKILCSLVFEMKTFYQL